MPSLGADMEAGTLVEWLKKPGDEVSRGDIIAVVDTQKGAIEIEVFEDGVLANYIVDIGSKVPVGTPMAMIDEARQEQRPERPVSGPSPIADAAHMETAPSPEQVAETTVSRTPPPVAARSLERLRITPAARRLATRKGIDPSSVTGSGQDGAIVMADVEASDPSTTNGRIADHRTTNKPERAVMRRAIAAAMARSKREIPHYYLSHTCDLSKADAFVSSYNADCPADQRILLAILFVKAVALALPKYPEFNGHFKDGVFIEAEKAHVGFAINIRGGGLVAPAIHDVDTLDLAALMTKMRDLVARVRIGRFRAAELSDPTITISCLGERGVEALFGVIYPPQVAIVGFGMPAMRPWINDGNIQPCLTVALTLAADHRVSDGHRGALFLSTINKYLQEPETL